MENTYSILVLDDDFDVLNATAHLLEAAGYKVDACANPKEALVRVKENVYDCVLTDIRMPEMDGLAFLEKVHDINGDIPIILMTAYAEIENTMEAIHKRAFEFVLKPYKPEYLLNTIKKAVNYNRLVLLEKNYKNKLEKDVEKRTLELAESLDTVKKMNIEMIRRLVTVCEFRDTDTGAHLKRIELYSRVTAETLGMSSDFVESIAFASQMHDIGKIGIPDNVLLKPGPLTNKEFDIMKTHTTIGAKMLQGSKHLNLKMAESIALTHHERYDGTGYPNGLRGEDIPIWGKIGMLSDQYDALRSERPYKPSFSHETTFVIITKGDIRTMPEHFDPKVLKAFIDSAHIFDEVYNEHKDLPS